MLEQIEKSAREKMDGAVEAMEREFATLRTGRASAGLLDSVTAEAYGAHSPLKAVATISVPDARTLMIQPWDKSLMPIIEKAILAANLGFTPNNDGKVIRITVPTLTEERRKDLVRLAHKEAEKGRVAIRNVRRHINDEVKKAAKDHGISENERDLQLERVQAMTDKEINRIDQLLAMKEKEIMEE